MLKVDRLTDGAAVDRRTHQTEQRLPSTTAALPSLPAQRFRAGLFLPLPEQVSVVLKRWTHTASVARRQSTPEMVDILPKRADACQAGSAEASYHANRGPEDGERR